MSIVLTDEDDHHDAQQEAIDEILDQASGARRGSQPLASMLRAQARLWWFRHALADSCRSTKSSGSLSIASSSRKGRERFGGVAPSPAVPTS
jgi:hypothetical protein